MRVSYKKGLRDPKINSSKSIEEILHQIKDNPNKDIIQLCRSIGKFLPDGIRNKSYEVLKSSLDIFFPSGVFGFKAKEENLNELSGFVFIDIDGLDNEQMIEVSSILKSTPYIYAFWKSISANGYGILAKVDDLTIKRYVPSINYIESIISISFPFDKMAKKITQPCFISYDPDLYINNNCTSLYIPDLLLPVLKEQKKKSLTKLPHKEKKERKDNIPVCEGLNKQKGVKEVLLKTYFDNEFYENESYKEIENGFAQIEVKLNPKRKILKGHRSKTLLSISNKLLLINSEITKEQLIKKVNDINHICCPEPLDDLEIIGIVTRSFFYLNNDTLYTKPETKYVSFNPDIPTTREFRMGIGGKIGRAHVKRETINKIIVGIKSLKNEGKEPLYRQLGKYQKEVAELTSTSISSVERYWHDCINETTPDIKPNDINILEASHFDFVRKESTITFIEGKKYIDSVPDFLEEIEYHFDDENEIKVEEIIYTLEEIEIAKDFGRTPAYVRAMHEHANKERAETKARKELEAKRPPKPSFHGTTDKEFDDWNYKLLCG
jgi:hypothetical protein